MSRQLTDPEILSELEPVAATNVNRHEAMTKDWHPHDYVPWDAAATSPRWAASTGRRSSPSSATSRKAAMITNLLTEDNLPSYHREIAENFSLDGAWGTWVGRWTAEENRHGIVMRDYLVVTRGVDPVALEQARMEHMTNGFASTARKRHDQAGFLLSVAYVTFQELATRVSHRNTGKVCDDPIADRMLQRVAADENLHMIFYRNIVRCRTGPRHPTRRCEAIAEVLDNFQMPGAGHAELPPQRGADRQARHLRPAPAPRRSRLPGAAQVEDLRARRLHRAGRTTPGTARRLPGKP